MPAVELDVPGGRERPLDVLHEADRDERVLAAPHEQRLVGHAAQARPQPAVAVRLVEVDVAGDGVEGVPAARGRVGAQELVHARRGPAVPRHEPASAPIVGRNDAFVPPRPWTASSGGPWPASAAEIGPNGVWYSCRRSRYGLRSLLVPAREPTATW